MPLAHLSASVVLCQLMSRSSVLPVIPATSIACVSASVDVTSSIPAGIDFIPVSLFLHYQRAAHPPGNKGPFPPASPLALPPPSRSVVLTQLQLPRWPVGLDCHHLQLRALPAPLDPHTVLALEPLTSPHRIDLLLQSSAGAAISLRTVGESILLKGLGMVRVEWAQYTTVVRVREELQNTSGGQLFVSSSSSSTSSSAPICCCCVLWSSEGGDRCHLRVFALSISQAAMFVSSLQSALSSCGVSIVLDTVNADNFESAQNLLSSLSRETELVVRCSSH